MRERIKKLNESLILLFPLTALILISCSDKSDRFFDKIDYSIQNYRIVSENCDTSGSCAYVEFNYPLFSGPESTPAVSVLNSYVSAALLADDYADSAVSSIEELGTNFVKEYENFIAEFTDYSFGWALERDIKVIYRDSNVISLEFYEYSFMGGAHPNTANTYQSFYLNTGSNIVIDDSSIINKLTTIGEKEFRKLKDIPEDKTLSSAGYWFEDDEFHLNDNFAITNEGIVFYFNPYEIAPYSLGPTKLIIKKEQLGGLINKILKK